MNNLPVLKEDDAKTKTNMMLPRMKETLGRTAKIVGMSTVAVASVVGMAFNPVFAVPFAVSAFSALDNIKNRKQKDIMFVTSKKLLGKETKICQDPTRLDLMSKIKHLNPADKAGVMMLQTLVGFSRYQQEFKNKKSKLVMNEIDGKSGILAYPQVFSTTTHGLNIKNLQALESLGYIKIIDDGKKDKRKLSLSKKIYKRYVLSKANDKEKVEKYFEEKRSLLILEKAGFGTLEKKDVKGNITDFFTGNIEGLEAKSKVMRTVRFQLTDKEIDFDDLYEKVNNPPENMSFKEQLALKRFRIIFDKQRGILKTANIDVRRDKYGIHRIEYGTKGFVDRKREEEEKTDERDSFVTRQKEEAPTLREQAEFAKAREDATEQHMETKEQETSTIPSEEQLIQE